MGTEPDIPDDVSWQDLDRDARAGLRSLPKELAERVGGHLAAAGLLIDSDPELARKHAAVARRLASRVGVVREAAGLTAYACGSYDSALAEFRAHRRLTGEQIHLPLMVDCERALGRPGRALELAATPEAGSLPPTAARELRIVVAGIRADMGQTRSGVLVLEADPAFSPGEKPGTDDERESVFRLQEAHRDLVQRLAAESDGSPEA
jgi:hypothetical protein